MKAPFVNRKSGGFTLIELLVVIAIILTLAGVTMAVVNGVMDNSKRTTAKSVCTNLATGIENYTMEYYGLPIMWNNKKQKANAKEGQLYITTDTNDDSGLMSILTNNLDKADDKYNKKGVTYFSSETTDSDGSPGLYFGGRGMTSLLDPWSSPYRVIMNMEPDDRSPNLYIDGRRINKNMAVYSVGKDGEGSIEDGKMSGDEAEDNVTSW